MKRFLLAAFLSLFAVQGAWAVPYGVAPPYKPIPYADQSEYGRSSTGSLTHLLKALATYDTVNQPPIWVVTFGSSICASLTDLTGNSVGQNLSAQVTRAFGAGGLYNFLYDNECVNGTVVQQFPTAWSAMQSKAVVTGSISGTTLTVTGVSSGALAAGYTLTGANVIAGTYIKSGSGSTWTVYPSQTAASNTVTASVVPTVVGFVYGENDGRAAAYNAGETFTLFSSSFLSASNTVAAASADAIYMTSHHYGVMSSINVPTPEAASFPNINEVYPVSVIAPVSCAQLIPTCANSLTSATDFYGNGQTIYQDVKYIRENQYQRWVASLRNSPVIDVERYSWRALETDMATKGENQYAAENFYYLSPFTGSPHPSAAGMSAFYTTAIANWGSELAYEAAQATAAGALPSGSVVGTTDTQTLTNKTLTAPAITSPTMTTPSLGAATATTLAIGGCTIGSFAECITGSLQVNVAVATNTYNDTQGFPRVSFTPGAGSGGTLNMGAGPTSTFSGPMKTGGYTVASLPAAPGTGARAYATDTTACSKNGALTGGGAIFCAVIYNGAAWVGE